MLLAALLACQGGGGPAPLADTAPRLAVSVAWKLEVDALLPTDLVATADGGFLVLDGARGRGLLFDPQRGPPTVLGDAARWGHPVRAAWATDDGVWIADPAGRLVKFDEDGAVAAQVEVGGADGGDATPAGPVALLDLGSDLLVADRRGRVSWVDPATGAVRHRADRGVDGAPFGTVTDLARGPDGDVYAADAVAGRVHRLSATGEVEASFGSYGLWVGALKQPKAVLGIGRGALVVDSALGALQLFDAEGRPRAVVSVDGAPLHLEHPIAVDRAATGEVLVLDAASATVWALSVGEAAVAAALVGEPPRWLREPLADPGADPAEAGGNCLQCHDGLVNDSRHVWDPSLDHHPVAVKPDRAIPAFYPLDDQGRLTCTTCHSPHGTASRADVEAVATEADRDALLPHARTVEPFLRVSRRDSALCLGCHGDAPHEGALTDLGLGGGGHPVGPALATAMARRPGGAGFDPAREQCLTCHAVHGAAGDHLTRGEADGRLCVGCHEGQADAARTHPMGLTGGGVHPAPKVGAGLPLDDGHPTCATCHDIVGGRGEALLRSPAGGEALCATCHAVDLGGGHATRGACLTCHDPHGAPVERALVHASGTPTAADPLGCLGCHGPGAAGAARPGALGHPVDGAVHGGGEALTCASCHLDVHDPAVTARDGGCADCHAAQATPGPAHGGATCLSCHPAHRASPLARAVPGAHPASAPCLTCHAPGTPGEGEKLAAWTHPDLFFRPDGVRWTPLAGLPLYGDDGAPVPAGQNGALACGSCHVTHRADLPEVKDHLRRPGWEDACASCHGDDALVLYRYFHRPDRRPGEAP